MSFAWENSGIILLVWIGLMLLVLLVNGWTDAPNAIAGVVVTRGLTFQKAVLLAAVCNLFGVLWGALSHPSVAETVFSLAQLPGEPHQVMLALCAVLTAVIVWSAVAWVWGIPTSESHGMLAALSGASLALGNEMTRLQWLAWGKVLAGLLISSVLGFWAGTQGAHWVHRWKKSPRFLAKAQIAGAAGSAWFHGAQDGQKFLGIFMYGLTLGQGGESIPLWMVLLCAAGMALGTGMGGKRIIDTIGRDMVQLTPKDSFAADAAGIGCLGLATWLGLPVSTTHTRTAAILGVGAAGGHGVNWKVARSIVWAWLLTFPGCMALGYGCTKLFCACF